MSPLDVVYRDNGVPVGYACSLPRIPQRVLKLSCLSTREILSLLHYLHHAINAKLCGERTTKYSPSFNTGAQGLHVRRLLDASLVFLHRVLGEH